MEYSKQNQSITILIQHNKNGKWQKSKTAHASEHCKEKARHTPRRAATQVRLMPRFWSICKPWDTLIQLGKINQLREKSCNCVQCEGHMSQSPTVTNRDTITGYVYKIYEEWMERIEHLNKNLFIFFFSFVFCRLTKQEHKYQLLVFVKHTEYQLEE